MDGIQDEIFLKGVQQMQLDGTAASRLYGMAREENVHVGCLTQQLSS